MRESRDVIEVQRVSGIARPDDIRVRPVRRRRQIKVRIAVRQSCGQISRLQRQIQLRRSQLQVIAPLRLAIKIKGGYRQQVSAGRGIGEIEDVLGCQQAPARVGRVAVLVADCKRCCQAPREVGTDLGPGSARGVDKRRTVADKARRRIAASEGVVRLRQPPDVMVAHDGAVAGAQAYLVVQRARAIVPHLQQPVGTEPDLGGEV